MTMDKFNWDEFVRITYLITKNDPQGACPDYRLAVMKDRVDGLSNEELLEAVLGDTELGLTNTDYPSEYIYGNIRENMLFKLESDIDYFLHPDLFKDGN